MPTKQEIIDAIGDEFDTASQQAVNFLAGKPAADVVASSQAMSDLISNLGVTIKGVFESYMPIAPERIVYDASSGPLDAQVGTSIGVNLDSAGGVINLPSAGNSDDMITLAYIAKSDASYFVSINSTDGFVLGLPDGSEIESGDGSGLENTLDITNNGEYKIMWNTLKDKWELRL